MSKPESSIKDKLDPKRWWVLLGVSLAAVLVALDYTIVNICLPTIQHYFAASTNTLQWLMLGFGISFASCLAGAGKLADIVGRRKVLYTSIGLFILASLGAGLAPNLLFLIAMRFLQGLSASALLPCGTAIIASTFPLHERPRAISFFGSMLGIGLAMGPVLGGLIVHFINWQWIFFINIPVSLLAVCFCALFGKMKESKHPDTPPIDWVGIFSLIVFIGSLCLAFSQAIAVGWLSTIVLACFLIMVVALIVLIINTKKQAHPIIPPRLLTHPSFLLGSVIYICNISFAWPVAFYVPLYLRKIPAFSITTASLWFFIMTGMTVITPMFASMIFNKHSKRAITHAALLTSIAGLVGLALFTVHTPIWLIVTAFVLYGFAWGAANGIAMPIGLNAAKDHADAGIVSGAILTLLNTLGTVLIAMATSIFNATEMQQMVKAVKTHAITLSQQQINTIKIYLANPEKTRQLIASFGHPHADAIMHQVKASFMHGFSTVFFVFAILVALLYAWRFRSINRLLKAK